MEKPIQKKQTNNHLETARATKNKSLFLAAFIATLFQIGWLTLEAFGFQPVLFEMTTVYLLILVTYVINNRILKWQDFSYKPRKGEFLVYFIWSYTFTVYTLYIFNLVPKIPEQLSITFSGVTVVFFGNEIVKFISRLLPEKSLH